MVTDVIYGVVLLVVVVGLVIWIMLIARRAKASAAASDARLVENLRAAAAELPPRKPFADETPAERGADVIAAATDRALAPEVATPALPKADRLAELADLHTQGLISDEELATARAKILAE